MRTSRSPYHVVEMYTLPESTRGGGAALGESGQALGVLACVLAAVGGLNLGSVEGDQHEISRVCLFGPVGFRR